MEYEVQKNHINSVHWREKPVHLSGMTFKETANERIFLVNDLAAVEEAAGLGAKIVEGEVAL
jgi:hypothetical protein